MPDELDLIEEEQVFELKPDVITAERLEDRGFVRSGEFWQKDTVKIRKQNLNEFAPTWILGIDGGGTVRKMVVHSLSHFSKMEQFIEHQARQLREGRAIRVSRLS